jgi:hypothetical protein
MKSTQSSGRVFVLGRRRRLLILLGLSLPIFIGILITPPIPQDLNYHDFVDQRPILGIPHMWNVVSNVPFALIGAMGCCWLLSRRNLSKPFA